MDHHRLYLGKTGQKKRNNNIMIAGLLFDYGGTIDTNGLHWAVVLRNAYRKFDLHPPEEIFSKAYAFGERSLAINPLVKPSHNFYDVLRLKIKEQFSFMREQGFDVDESYAEKIAQSCNQFARETVESAKPVLEDLAKEYPLVMVSNFYGNLNTVLEDFGIRPLFRQVVESAVVGVRKPSPEIYQLGVNALGLEAGNCLVIGDSFTKDIVPAKTIGCRTLWLRKEGWEEDINPSAENAVKSDIEVRDFSEIRKHLLKA
jgi:HAD superfamily hydrolase (TIGR01549 family)